VHAHRYRITISSGLTETYHEAFGDFHIEPNGSNTTLTGELDQSGLYGALNRIQAPGLELVELVRLADHAS
jgi:hypothetical protein